MNSKNVARAINNYGIIAQAVSDSRVVINTGGGGAQPICQAAIERQDGEGLCAVALHEDGDLDAPCYARVALWTIDPIEVARRALAVIWGFHDPECDCDVCNLAGKRIARD